MDLNKQIGLIIQRALKDKERGLAKFKVGLEADVLEHLMVMSIGNA